MHTQAADESGNVVGKVLHAGTGRARFMVMTADACTGARAYAGLVSSYYEQVTTDFKRLDDAAWADRFNSITPPASVAWMSDVVTSSK